MNLKNFTEISYLKIKSKSPRFAKSMKFLLKPIFNVVFSHRASYMSNGLVTSFQAKIPCMDFLPLVTVIVPNFNHDNYLEERLETIYGQTYKNFEVILLDDSSNDSSVEILKKFQQEYPNITRTLFNSHNSGSVFKQWKKGINNAKGELIWIAESDDYCSSNFLECLVPFFINQANLLSYCETVFVNSKGNRIWTMEEYLTDLKPFIWDGSFIKTSQEIVEQYFSKKNIIPNASSAIFRKSNFLEIFSTKEWQNMKVCGDWIFYLHAIKGGLISYSKDAQNFYRNHGKNTSVQSHENDIFYREHEIVAKHLKCLYKNISNSVFSNMRADLVVHWKRSRNDFKRSLFESCFSEKRIKSHSCKRPLNILMAGYAFCSGGGETFPIVLSNAMKSKGHNVTYLDCMREDENIDIRSQLRPDIPVVSNLEGLNHIVREFKIDLIHSHHAWVDSSIADILDSELHCRTVVSLHGMYELMPSENRKDIVSKMLDKTTKFVYTAQKNLEAFGDAVTRNSQFDRIDNALEDYPIEVIKRSDINIPENSFVVTLVSRAVPEKGWIEATKAIDMARSNAKVDIHLILIGDGKLFDYLKSKRLPEYIHLMGFQKNIRGFFQISQLGLLPSRFIGESFPLVLIDCLKSGTPMVASSVGEVPYMLEHESIMAGEIFDLDSNQMIPIKALSEIISRIATDKNYLSELKTNTEKVVKKFDLGRMSKKYEEVYYDAIQND